MPRLWVSKIEVWDLAVQTLGSQPDDCLNEPENVASPLMDKASLLADKASPPANEPNDFDSMSNC